MTYRKPEVLILGEASRVIENPNQKGTLTKDQENPVKHISAAYDLDE